MNLISDAERDIKSVLTVDPDRKLCTYFRGSANGIICLEIKWLKEEWRNYECYWGLWNPATRDFKIVAFPKPPYQRFIVGFMFDALSNDFKIMALTSIESDHPYINLAYDIYSLSTNSWKRLSDQPLLLGALGLGFVNASTSTMDTFVNGVYYWTATLSTDIESGDRILSFNLSTETFQISNPPKGVVHPLDPGVGGFMWEIGLYEEFLALFVSRKPELVASIDIWVVTEFDNLGAPIAWQCLVAIAPIHNVRYAPSVRTPRLDGDLLLCLDDNELWLYNPTTSKFRNLSVTINNCFRYVESLFPLSRRVVRS